MGMKPGDIIKSDKTEPMDLTSIFQQFGTSATAAGTAAQSKNYLGAIGSGASAGATIGSAIAPGIGTAVGGLLGGVAGGVMTALQPEDEETEAERLAKENVRLQNKAIKQNMAEKQRSMDWMTKLSNKFKYR